jgi:hypothetical protein
MVGLFPAIRALATSRKVGHVAFAAVGSWFGAFASVTWLVRRQPTSAPPVMIRRDAKKDARRHVLVSEWQ